LWANFQQGGKTVEMTSLIDVLIGLVITGLAWFLSEQNKETKRLGILINKTREDYATRMELRDDMNKVMDALHRVEDKLDKVLSRD
jgi:uncharacterized membrane protein YccC